MPKLSLPTGTIRVSGPNADSLVVFEVHSASIHWCDDNVIPIDTFSTFEDDPVNLIPKIGCIVDICVEPQPDNTIGGILEGAGPLSGAVRGRRETTPEGEADPAPEPGQAGACLNADVLREAAHVTRGGGALTFLGDCVVRPITRVQIIGSSVPEEETSSCTIDIGR